MQSEIRSAVLIKVCCSLR